MAMLSDLRFWDDRLETCFEHELAETRAGAVSGFAIFRAGTLIFVTAKAVIEGQSWTITLLFAVGLMCSLLPYLSVRCRDRKHFRAWQWAALLTDVAQAAIGCYNHVHMAPSGEGISPLASLVYLSYGSTALWMLCYTSFSHLPFWMELVKAATISVVLLAFNDRICRDSPGLRRAYGVIHQLVRVVLRHRPLARALWPAAAHTQLAQQAGGSGSGGAPHATWICTQYQMHVVLLAFVATTWAVHRTERRLRLQMLYRCTQQSTTAQSSSRHELAGAATAALEEEAASGSAVSDMDFFLGFGIPAALGILMVFALDF
ncbi:hypothetical protein D9Q98_003342 [Chlorella vulgaris]|uniref:Uncharacterized protein n=1 Tax=Chlorella vulgaris TaxID=3077 RepID=A0A9D4YYE3_CHLVU|nr:hypothetical protein D9Q98_003342 [Chlorella vulgaris]